MNLGTFSVMLKEKMVRTYCFICVFMLAVLWMNLCQSQCAQSRSGHHCMLVHMHVLASPDHIKGSICHTEAAHLIQSGFLLLLNVDRQFLTDFCTTQVQVVEARRCFSWIWVGFLINTRWSRCENLAWKESMHIHPVKTFICSLQKIKTDEFCRKNLWRMVEELFHVLTHKLWWCKISISFEKQQTVKQ